MADKQGTAPSSKFLDACRKYNAGDLSQDQLIDRAVRDGFNNVIDAFHVIGTAPISKKFFIDERSGNKGIRITDEFSALVAARKLAVVEIRNFWLRRPTLHPVRPRAGQKNFEQRL